jgi:hypothetical protein
MTQWALGGAVRLRAHVKNWGHREGTKLFEETVNVMSIAESCSICSRPCCGQRGGLDGARRILQEEHHTYVIQSKEIENPFFSLCFRPSANSSKEKVLPGFMSLGRWGKKRPILGEGDKTGCCRCQRDDPDPGGRSLELFAFEEIKATAVGGGGLGEGRWMLKTIA